MTRPTVDPTSGPTSDRRWRLVTATANPGKVAELAELLRHVADLEPRPAGLAEIVEDAGTLEGNALLKARAVWRASGGAALADDTGLEVDALGGAPGVETAYYAGPTATDAENRARLLADLAGVTDRTARFRTVMAVVIGEGDELVVEGVCEGRIAPAERGDRGFGYDAVFIPAAGDGRTFAEMGLESKNAVSHRAAAVAALIAALTNRADRPASGR